MANDGNAQVVEVRWSSLPWPDAQTSTTGLLHATREQLDFAHRLHREGKADAAIAILENLTAQHPNYVGALYRLGRLHAERGNYRRALVCLVHAAMLNPHSWQMLMELSRVYLGLEAREMAAQVLEQASRLKGDDAKILVTLGEIYHEEREYELAAEAYRRALAIEATLKGALFGLASVYTKLGHYEEAAEAYERLLKQGHRSLGVIQALASLPAAVVSVNLEPLLNKVRKKASDDKDDFENHLAFTRAQILDRAGCYEEAWENLIGANRTLYLHHKKSVERTSAMQRESLAELRAKSWKARGGSAGVGKNAISLFIFGPSRSGKTTMEKLVGALPGVKRGYENPIAGNAVRQAFHNAGFLDVGRYLFLPPKFASVCRELYEEELERRAGCAKVFTNTGPGRIHDAACMASVLPNLRFIFIKRDPDDVALRIFQTRYHRGNFYGYHMRTVREHITWCYDMIDDLTAMFPTISRVVHYEDMVADPMGALSQAAELCGLEMPPGSIPPIGDDRGCAAPYRELMAAVLAD
jgi:tetratricopeptide (TPR) repeat protein